MGCHRSTLGENAESCQSKYLHGLVVLGAEPRHIEVALLSEEAHMMRKLSPALSSPELEVHPTGSSVFTIRGLEALVGIEMHEG